MEIGLGYCRVSSEEQSEGWSLQAQENEIQRYADAHGISLSRIVVESIRASDPNDASLFDLSVKQYLSKFRPILFGLLRELKPGMVFLVWKFDRLTRSDFGGLMRNYMRSLGCRLVSVTEGEDDFVLGIHGVMARQETKKLKERIMQSRIQMLEQGVYPFAAPYGFKSKGKGIMRKLIPVPVEIEKIRVVFGCADYKDAMQRTGLAKGMIYKIWGNRFYEGVCEFEAHSYTLLVIEKSIIELAKSFKQKLKYKDCSTPQLEMPPIAPLSPEQH